MLAAPPLQAEVAVSASDATRTGSRFPRLWLCLVVALILPAGVTVAETDPPPADALSPVAQEVDWPELKAKLDAQLERMADQLTADLQDDVDQTVANALSQVAAGLAGRQDQRLARRTNASDRLDAQLATMNTRPHNGAVTVVFIRSDSQPTLEMDSDSARGERAAEVTTPPAWIRD